MSINRNVPSPINLPVPSLDLSSCELSVRTRVEVSVIVALRSASKPLSRAVRSCVSVKTIGAATGAAVGDAEGGDVGNGVGQGVTVGVALGTLVGQGVGAGEGIWFSALCCHVVGDRLGPVGCGDGSLLCPYPMW